ncbi:hypothetical protein PInf_003686 [Phytophthora infestans]|nr:hypothetical protein PInf_003686 [Phytophthora infestans]
MDALQAACVALHAPPTGPEAERRRAEAESVLEHFKRSPSALNDAMTLLRDSQTPPVVQFHCVATIREVTLQRWPLLALPDKSQALDFLMQLLLERGAAAPRFVAAAALQTAVLLVKRGWLDRLESERSAVLQQMGTMLQPGNAIAHRLLAAKWLLAFVTEFSSASRASNMMQPVEFHTKSRRTLEKSGGLKDIVALAVPLLEDSIRSTTTACGDAGAAGDVPAEQLELLDSAFRLCVELLNWQFEDPRVGNLTWSLTVSASDDDTGNRPVLVPQASWRPILVRPDLIHSAFNTYAFFRNVAAKNETLLHLARQFLIQLASLQGPIFERKTEQVQFLGEIFRGVVTVVHNPFLDLLAHSDITGYELATRELIDCCQLLFRLVNNIGLTALLQASSGQLLSSFIDELASLTSKLLHSALERIQRHLRENPNEAIDELWELEGVDILLDAWVALANDPQLLEVGVSKSAKPEAEQALALLSKASAPVVELYLQVQLELCAVEVLAEQDEDEDVEDNAASSAREQYELAAALARLNGSASASLLVSLLQSLMNSIQQELTKLQGRDEMTPVLSQLFEKLHFVILFAGLLLADDFEGERPGIPDRVYVTLQGVANAGESPVVSLIMLIMSHVLEFETTRNGITDQNMRAAHFQAVSQPLAQRLQQLIAMPNFESKQTANDVRVQEELKLLVETYSGIARSAESASHAPITAFCLPALPVIVKIFQIFQGDSQIVNLILNFFCVMVEAQLCYLSPRDALQVYTASDDLIRAYCRHNLGKKSMLGDAEEENYVDLLALLTLLSHLVSKDFIDFSEDATTQQEQADATRASSVVADVVFSGLRQVIPLMTEQLLAYPSLSKQYFTLVTYMVEVYAEKLVSLPSELFQMLLHSLLIGMRHVSVDVVRNSFQALSELASYHWKALQSQRPGLEAHRQQNPDMFMAFLRVIFHMALSEDFNPAILDACAGTLYPLILIEQARYSALAEEISREQTSMDTASQQRLAAAFAELITFLSPADIATGTATTRRMRTQFKTNLYAFVAEVRGFLQVK